MAGEFSFSFSLFYANFRPQNKFKESPMRLLFFAVFLFAAFPSFSQRTFFSSKDFSITDKTVRQGKFEATAVSSTELTSTYKSNYKKAAQNKLNFKFSLNGADNERGFAQDHHLSLKPEKGKMIAPVIVFGEADKLVSDEAEKPLDQDFSLTLRVDMRKVLKDFKEKGYYELFNSEKFYAKDFKGLFVAGNISPLSWDFQTLGSKKQFQLTDENNDGIFEITIPIKKEISAQDEDALTTNWKLSKNISLYPQLHSGSTLLDALYNKALEEMILDIRDDGAFMAGEKWPGVWTRDISYSIQLAFAIVNPDAAKTSLLAKVKNGKIIQDTGTGGAWPVSSDRMTWALAAWEIYKVTGDEDWLKKSYAIIKKSALADLEPVRDKQTGLFNGESSFLDWREQTYPVWMDPKDIYASKNLGTNAVHFQTYTILAMMADAFHKDASLFRETASSIKNAMNKVMWLPGKKYYGQFLYGRNYQSLSPKSEALGEALSVLFSIPDAARQKEIVENTPVTKFGIPCVFPQTPNIPPYHNDAVWAFVQAYWTLASAKVKNELSVDRSLASIYRAAALFLTNKENFVATNGDYVGTQINSNRQLWSVAGNLAMTYRVFFGMNFEPDKLTLLPFIPKSYQGERTLSNYKYRNAELTIAVKGYGSAIQSFKVDGEIQKEYFISGSLSGKHTIEIVMNNKIEKSKINLVPNEYAPETPALSYKNNAIEWTKIADASFYEIFKNGKFLEKTTKMTFPVIQEEMLNEYQVRSVAKNGLSSFLSSPFWYCGATTIIEMENYSPTSDNKFKNYSGKGYIVLERKNLFDITFPFTAAEEGDYAIDFRYANGNGPLNTENKCAIRSLMVDNQFAGAVVMPHRGENTWDVFDYSNGIHVHLTKGTHHFTITYRPSDENMNEEVNGAMLDCARIRLLNKK